MTFLRSSKSSKKGLFSSAAKKTIYRTMMFGNLVSFLITTGSCQVNQELAEKRHQERVKKRALRDSLILAQKQEYFIELQGQNIRDSRDYEDH